MDYIYGLFGKTPSQEECATKIQSIFRGHSYRRKVNAAVIIQKYYKRYNVLRLSQVYQDISTNQVKINHTGVEYCKGLETEQYDSEQEEMDDELETIYINKRKQLLKLHRKLLIVKNELRILESGNLPEPKLKLA